MSDSVDLPPGWCRSNLEEVARSAGGGTPAKSDPSFWTDGSIPWVSPKDMKVFNVTSSEDTLAEKALDRLTLIPAESVLVVVRSGILSRTLPVALNKLPVTINQDMRAFVPADGISAKFLALQLMAREREVLSNCSKDGTTVASIEGPALARFPFAIAPALQQTRIVAKLEELLSDLDAGVAELKAAQKKLAQYRQSLLKAAVEGALTAEWRAKHPPTETGAQLLEGILRERRARWEAKQLAKFKDQGKAPPKGWQDKYPEPVQPDTTDLPALPQGWVWASIEQLGDVTTGFTPSTADPDNFGGPIPFIKPSDLDVGYSVTSSRDTLSMRGASIGRVLPENSVLVTCIGATIGKTGLARIACATNQQINAITAAEGGVIPEFLYWALVSGFGQKQIIGNASATTLPILNKTKFEKLALPIPPVSEQQAVISLLESESTRLVEMETASQRGLRQSTAQRQNILRAAFSGQLVPQDPNDEPASELLARIRAERAARDAVKNPRGRKPREAA